MLHTPLVDLTWQVVTRRRLIVDIVPGWVPRGAGVILAAVGGVLLLQSLVHILADVPSLLQTLGIAPARSAGALGIVLGGLIGNLGFSLATHAHKVIVDCDKGTVDDIHVRGFSPRKASHRLGAFERVLVGWSRSPRSGAVVSRSLDVTMRAPGRTLLVATIPAARSRQAHDLGAAVAAASGLRFESVVEADSRA